jgi:hypothetical protein
MYQIIETELSGAALTLFRRKGVEYHVRLSRNRAIAEHFGEEASLLSSAFSTDTAEAGGRMWRTAAAGVEQPSTRTDIVAVDSGP